MEKSDSTTREGEEQSISFTRRFLMAAGSITLLAGIVQNTAAAFATIQGNEKAMEYFQDGLTPTIIGAVAIGGALAMKPKAQN